MLDEYKEWVPIIPWVLTIVGWGVVNWFALKRDKRKEVRAEIDFITKNIRQIVDVYSEYLESQEKSNAQKNTAGRLKAELQRLGFQIQRIEKKVCHKNIQKAHTDLFEAITGGEFETRSTGATNPMLFLKASGIAEQLINEIENQFFADFK